MSQELACRLKAAYVQWENHRGEFGSDLLSHTVARAVPSALKDFTSVFGMGTGVAPSL